MSVLLIHPPFASPFYPSISIPALAAYLRSRNIDVSAFDANNAFFRASLQPSRLEKAWERVSGRLQQLNTQPKLSFSELAELGRLLHLVQAAPASLERLQERLADRAQSRPDQLLPLLQFAINLSTHLDFPEIVDVDGPFTRYLSGYSEYSSRDLLAAAEQDGAWRDLLKRAIAPQITAVKPDIVGISVGFPSQVVPAFACARLVKRLAPATHVCLGGSFISCHMRHLRETAIFDLVDSLVLDDGEIPLEHLVRELSGPCPDLERVPNLIYRRAGKIRRTATRAPADMTSLPLPAFDVYPLDEYLLPRQAMVLPFRLSRGCSWGRCAFCRTQISMVCDHQQPNPDHLFERLRDMVRQTSMRGVHFTDDSASPLILEALCRRIVGEGLEIAWMTHLRFDLQLDRERCRLFRRAGCRQLTLGLEAHNDRLLRLMRKGTNVKMIHHVLSNISWAGIPASAYMIVGLPTETEQEALDSHARVRELQRRGRLQHLHYTLFRIEAHSDIASHPEHYGILRLNAPADQDLDPPVIDFDSTAMSRQRAVRLGLFKSARVAVLSPDQPRNAGWIGWNGHDLPLRHDIHAIRSTIRRLWEQTGWDGRLSFGRWLENGDHLVPASAPQTDPGERTPSPQSGAEQGL